jgi:hypothetical protein
MSADAGLFDMLPDRSPLSMTAGMADIDTWTAAGRFARVSRFSDDSIVN